MRLTVLASGSAGNGYVLEGRTSALIIECGVSPERAFRETGISPSKVSGVLVSHEHGDHAAYLERYCRLGMPVFASVGTLRARNACAFPRVFALAADRPAQVGDFYIMPFAVEHDAAEPLGFYISGPEIGRLMFITDAARIPWDHVDICMDTIMVEANWSEEILERRVASGEEEISRAARIKETHLSLERACELVNMIDGPSLRNVVLLHLSDRNGDAALFAAQMHKAVRLADVHVARPGLTVELSSTQLFSNL